jgi:hypothetical protein
MSVQSSWNDLFYERWGGFLVALFFHLALLSFLLTRHIEPPALPEEPEVQKIAIMLTPPKEPTLPAAARLAPEVAPAAETAPDIAQTAPPTEAPATEPEPAEEAASPPPPPATTVQRLFSDQVKQELERDRQELAMVRTELEKEQTLMHGKIVKESIAAEGRKFQIRTSGDPKGVVRTLELTNYPQAIVDRVLKKYGIRIVRKFVRDQDPQVTYLNTAETREGLFRSQRGMGVFDVFSLTPQAVAKMSELETAEIVRRGHDPNRTRVIEVRFGIVKTGDDYDLGIIDIKVEEIK